MPKRLLTLLVAAAAIAACGEDDATKYLNQDDPLRAPPPVVAEARYNGPGNGGDSVLDIAADGDGNSFVIGVTWGASFTNDMTIVKYGSDLSEDWLVAYNGPANGDDTPVQVAVDESGNAYVTGYSFGGETDFDMVTIKYDPAGAVQWVARYGDSAGDAEIPTGIAIGPEGTIYVTGNIQDTKRRVAYKAVVVAYSSGGEERWAEVLDSETLQTEGPDYVSNSGVQLSAVSADPLGGVVVTGVRHGSPLFDRCGDDEKSISSNYITIGYSSDGTRRWTSEYDGPCDDAPRFAIDTFDTEVSDAARLLAVDREGNAYVAGDSGGRMRIVKYDRAGQQQWVSEYVPPGGSDSWSLSDSLRTISFDPDRGRILVTLTACCKDGDFPDVLFIATVAYDANGDLLWAVRFDEEPNEEAGDVAMAPNGDIVVVGLAGDTDSAGERFEQHVLTVAYDAGGRLLWEARQAKYVDSPLARRWRPHAVVHRDGRVVVAGTTAGGGTDRDFAVVAYED